ncbi:TRAP-type C4-dicarboxylate transport system permease small subunit [Roseibium hamelinense]|uniref:TRAP transporter small permease protein n=1 Tax=Roseibium hamelinense TaxID=150831 RepID=A0A562TAU8_9HYPH|nr:TRAP transporter small permease [Roseibium hamelinense]MTI45290.1 TRAP transporter small permease [Roseibium hamelinense]TWI90344.1 TRAP-type C4-dicarboxylate transport system permease small subunit [Roseibium hamelinense]
MPDESTQPAPSRLWLGVKTILGLACVIVLFALMGLICVDVVARYFFNSPIRGAYELTEIFLAVLIFLALPLTTQARGHIEVELLNGLKSRFLDSLATVVAALSTIGVFAILSYVVWEHAEKLASRGTVTNSLELPLATIGYLAALSCALSAVLFFLQSLRRI